MRIGRQEIRAPQLSAPISHYTDAVRCGDFLFISGCVAFDGNGNTVAKNDVVGQAQRALENMGICLSAAGMGFEDVVKVTVFLINIEDRAAINPVREKFFGQARPASTLIGVKTLAAPDLLVEIEAVAYVADSGDEKFSRQNGRSQ